MRSRAQSANALRNPCSVVRDDPAAIHANSLAATQIGALSHLSSGRMPWVVCFDAAFLLTPPVLFPASSGSN